MCPSNICAMMILKNERSLRYSTRTRLNSREGVSFAQLLKYLSLNTIPLSFTFDVELIFFLDVQLILPLMKPVEIGVLSQSSKWTMAEFLDRTRAILNLKFCLPDFELKIIQISKWLWPIGDAPEKETRLVPVVSEHLADSKDGCSTLFENLWSTILACDSYRVFNTTEDESGETETFMQDWMKIDWPGFVFCSRYMQSEVFETAFFESDPCVLASFPNCQLARFLLAQISFLRKSARSSASTGLRIKVLFQSVVLEVVIIATILWTNVHTHCTYMHAVCVYKWTFHRPDLEPTPMHKSSSEVFALPLENLSSRFYSCSHHSKSHVRNETTFTTDNVQTLFGAVGREVFQGIGAIRLGSINLIFSSNLVQTWDLVRRLGSFICHFFPNLQASWCLGAINHNSNAEDWLTGWPMQTFALSKG